jgi:hypothetical protein
MSTRDPILTRETVLSDIKSTLADHKKSSSAAAGESALEAQQVELVQMETECYVKRIHQLLNKAKEIYKLASENHF